jgi:hypothetical protein
MPRTRPAPAPDRPRRQYPAKDDPARLALAGRIPDAALGALIGCTRTAVSAWRRTRTPPIAPFRGLDVPDALWPDVATLAAATGADLTPWAPADVVRPKAPAPPLEWQAPPTWAPAADGDTP